MKDSMFSKTGVKKGLISKSLTRMLKEELDAGIDPETIKSAIDLMQPNVMDLNSNLFKDKITIFYSGGAGGHFIQHILNELITQTPGTLFENPTGNEYIGKIDSIINIQYLQPWMIKDHEVDFSIERKEKVTQQLKSTRYIICVEHKHNEWWCPVLYMIKTWIRHGGEDMKPVFLKPLIKKYIEHGYSTDLKSEFQDGYDTFIQIHKDNPNSIWYLTDPLGVDNKLKIMSRWIAETLLKNSIDHMVIDYDDLVVNPTLELCKQLMRNLGSDNVNTKSNTLLLALQKYHKNNVKVIKNFT